MTTPTPAEEFSASVESWRQFFSHFLPEVDFPEFSKPEDIPSDFKPTSRLVVRPAGLSSATIFKLAQNTGKFVIDGDILGKLDAIAANDTQAPEVFWIDWNEDPRPLMTPIDCFKTDFKGISLGDIALLVAFDAWNHVENGVQRELPDALIVTVMSYMPTLALLMPMVSFSSTDNQYHAYAMPHDDLLGRPDPSFIIPRRVTPH